jgi:IS5 family transposase
MEEMLIDTPCFRRFAGVEHPFRIINCQFGFRKAFHRGIRKNNLKLMLLFAMANLWMVHKRRPDPACYKGLVCQRNDNHPINKQNLSWKSPERLAKDCYGRKRSKTCAVLSDS